MIVDRGALGKPDSVSGGVGAADAIGGDIGAADAIGGPDEVGATEALGFPNSIGNNMILGGSTVFGSFDAMGDIVCSVGIALGNAKSMIWRVGNEVCGWTEGLM